MKIELTAFAGEIPRIDDRLLPDAHASACAGARLERGHIAPMRTDATIQTLGAAAESIYRHNGVFLSFPGDVDCASGPVSADRLYITRSDAAPQVYTSVIGYRGLALTAPAVMPTLALGAGTVNLNLSEDILFSYTLLTDLGEETKPSPPSLAVIWSPGINITVTMAAAPVDARYVARRIYRSQTSITGATSFYFVKEVVVATTVLIHNIVTDPLQELLPSDDYDPPVSGLQGLTAMPNGIMAGFVGRTLYFSEPYKPHAWPERYSLTTNEAIVGLSAFGTSLAVVTAGNPYVIQGLTPETMVMTRIEVDLPCVSKRGIVDMGYAAIFPSTRGLAQISDQGAVLLSQPIWTRDQWVALNPATIRAAQVNGRYCMSHDPSGAGPRSLVMVDVSGEASFIVPMTGQQYKDLIYEVPTSKSYGLDINGVTIRELDPATGLLRSYSWKSKRFSFASPVSFGVFRVESANPATGNIAAFSAQVIADGQVIASYGANMGLMRVADGEFSEWFVQVSGNHTVFRIILAGTPDEVAT